MHCKFDLALFKTDLTFLKSMYDGTTLSQICRSGSDTLSQIGDLGGGWTTSIGLDKNLRLVLCEFHLRSKNSIPFCLDPVEYKLAPSTSSPAKPFYECEDRLFEQLSLIQNTVESAGFFPKSTYLVKRGIPFASEEFLAFITELRSLLHQAQKSLCNASSPQSPVQTQATTKLPADKQTATGISTALVCSPYAMTTTKKAIRWQAISDLLWKIEAASCRSFNFKECQHWLTIVSYLSTVETKSELQPFVDALKSIRSHLHGLIPAPDFIDLACNELSALIKSKQEQVSMRVLSASKDTGSEEKKALGSQTATSAGNKDTHLKSVISSKSADTLPNPATQQLVSTPKTSQRPVTQAVKPISPHDRKMMRLKTLPLAEKWGEVKKGKANPELVNFRRQHGDVTIGLPVRWTQPEQLSYFTAVEHLQTATNAVSKLWKWVTESPEPEQYMRPVTYLYEGVPIRLVRNDGIVLVLDPGQIQPDLVFKCNAYTDRLTDLKTKAQRDAAAQDVTYKEFKKNSDKNRCNEEKKPPVRLSSNISLWLKMLEHGDWPSTLDNPPRSSGRLGMDVQTGQLTFKPGKDLSAPLFSEQTVAHNEVLCQPIKLYMIQGTAHSISQRYFQAKNSIYDSLGLRLDIHFFCVREALLQKRYKTDLPFAIYNESNGCLLEVGIPEDLLTPFALGLLQRSQSIIPHIYSGTQRLQKKCNSFGFCWITLQRMLMFTPLKNQLALFEATDSMGETVCREEFINLIWTAAFAPCITIHQPDNIAETVQQLIHYLYHCPIDRHELQTCLTNKTTPVKLSGRPTPSTACAAAITSMWMCQLLKTAGVPLTRQEVLLLSYTLVLTESHADPNDRLHFLIKKLFSPSFHRELIDLMRKAVKHPAVTGSDNQKAELYRAILAFSTGVTRQLGDKTHRVTNIWCRGAAEGFPILSDLLSGEMTSERFGYAMNGMVDVMFLNGLVIAQDERGGVITPALRKEIADSDYKRREFFASRKLKLDLSANVWKGLCEQISDKCRRELCVAAGIALPRTVELRDIPLPSSINLLDMLCIKMEEQHKALRDLISILQAGLPPVSIDYMRYDLAKMATKHALLRKGIETEKEKKRDRQKLAENYRSPTASA